MTNPAPTTTTAPAPHPGERLATYFENFFRTIVAVSTLGASLTFSKVVSTPVVPWIDHGFHTNRIQFFLSISWLLFVLDLVVTSFAASAMTLYRPQAVAYFGTQDSGDRRVVMWYATGVSFVLFGLLLAAFLFLSLVVVAYVGSIGWAAVGLTVVVGVVGLGVIVWQSPIGSQAPGVPYASSSDERFERSGYREKMGWYEEENVTPVKNRHDEDVFQAAEKNDFDEEYEDVRFQAGSPLPREDLSRRSTLSRPVPAFVPAYTEEVRNYRAYRMRHVSGNSGRDVHIGGDGEEPDTPDRKSGYYYQDHEL